MQKTTVHLHVPFAANKPKQFKEKEQENEIDLVKACLNQEGGWFILLPMGYSQVASKY